MKVKYRSMKLIFSMYFFKVDNNKIKTFNQIFNLVLCGGACLFKHIYFIVVLCCSFDFHDIWFMGYEVIWDVFAETSLECASVSFYLYRLLDKDRMLTFSRKVSECSLDNFI